MPVRLRITILFTGLVIIILGLLCFGVYYFSHDSRSNSIRIRLNNRAITTARLLAQREIFDKSLIQRIDSLTTISLRNKVVQAYDSANNRVYGYSDVAGDTISVDSETLDEARLNGSIFFTEGDKEAVAYYYTGVNAGLVVVSAAEDVDGRQYLQDLRRILLLSFLAAVVAVLMVGYFFSGRLLLPVKNIAGEVDEISAQNLSRRIKTGAGNDEWNYLSETLNKLLNRLQESFEMQRRFISNASHELSTPLTSISSQLEVALQRERDAGYSRKVMQSIYDDVRRMTKLVHTLLEFAKAAGNPGGLDIKPMRVDEIILRLPAEIQSRNREYNVSIEFNDLPENEDDLIIFGNEELLFVAISNIVINACKYSMDHRAVVSLEAVSGQVNISVRDKGQVIPEGEIARIFEPFYRAKSDSEGFGLGLSLSHRILKLHRGHIEVGSTVNRETQFLISLPSASSIGS